MKGEHLAGCFALNEPLVASQEIEGETILIHFDSGHYYCANPTGSLIIERIRAGDALADVVSALCASCAIDADVARQSVVRFVGTLVTEGLIVPQAFPAASAPTTAAATTPLAFEEPALQKFDDLQDLLMLDPIHDVDQAGWPMPAPADTSATS